MKQLCRDGTPAWKVRLGFLIAYVVLFPFTFKAPVTFWFLCFMIPALLVCLYRDWKNEKT